MDYLHKEDSSNRRVRTQDGRVGTTEGQSGSWTPVKFEGEEYVFGQKFRPMDLTLIEPLSEDETTEASSSRNGENVNDSDDSDYEEEGTRDGRYNWTEAEIKSE